MGKTLEEEGRLRKALAALSKLNPDELQVLRQYVAARQEALGGGKEPKAPAMYRRAGGGFDVWDGKGDPPAWFQKRMRQGRPMREVINPAWVAWRDEMQGGPAKYEDPDDPRLTWDGKRYAGEIPHRAEWLRDYLDEGRELEEFLNPRWVETQNNNRIRKTKFRDPENPLSVWSGVGLKPVWVKARLKEGYTLEELRIEPSEGEG
jgi:DNA-binding protein H-NS